MGFLAGALSMACTEQRPECVLSPEAGWIALEVASEGSVATHTGTVTVEPSGEGRFAFVLRSASGSMSGTFKVPDGGSLIGSWYGELETGPISLLREGQLVLRANRSSPPYFGIWGLSTRTAALRQFSVEYQGADCVTRDECREWSAATMVVTSSLGGATLRLAPGARAELAGYMLGNGASVAGHATSPECLDVFGGFESGYFLQLSPPR
jgi:hypothetical protein